MKYREILKILEVTQGHFNRYCSVWAPKCTEIGQNVTKYLIFGRFWRDMWTEKSHNDRFLADKLKNDSE